MSEPTAYHAKSLSIDETQALITEAILTGRAFMASRVGSVELSCLSHYMNKRDRFWKFFPFGIQKQMENNAGFINSSTKALHLFSELYIQDLNDANLMGIWQKDEESALFSEFCPNASLTELNHLSPFHPNTPQPWTSALAGKRVLIIHPFEDTIREQYKKRAHLFSTPHILPQFKLVTLKAVQSIAKSCTEFNDWFEALAHMRTQINAKEFDVALIAAGAYGLPLAAHIKRMGKPVVHLGGALQLLFGIKGRRWDTESTYIPSLYNEHWTRPSDAERPAKFKKVESGTYW